MSELTPDDKQKIRSAFLEEVSQRPLTIGVVGVSGVGKSSTINAMFKTQLKVSHTVAGTKEFSATDLSLRVTHGEAQGENINLTIIDAPGMGEDIGLDAGYIQMYQENLPACDVILWVLSGRNRAIALDQHYLQVFQEFGSRMVFGINQIDLVHPLDWNTKINLPSTIMEQNIKDIVSDRTAKLQSICQMPIKVIPYSAERGYNLEQLFAAIIESAPTHRRWLFASLKNFSYRDFLPQELIAEIHFPTTKASSCSLFSNMRKPIRRQWQRFSRALSRFLAIARQAVVYRCV